MKGGKGNRSTTSSTGTGTGSADGAASAVSDISEGDQFDPAVRDALVKRAEAEALQCQQDLKITVAKTQQEEEEEAVKKLPAKKTVPGSSSAEANQHKQQQALGEANQVENTEELKGDEIMTNTASNQFMQLAMGFNEAAKMEKHETAANSGNDPNQPSAEIAVQPENAQDVHHPHIHLIAAAAAATEPLPQLLRHHGSADTAQPGAFHRDGPDAHLYNNTPVATPPEPNNEFMPSNADNHEGLVQANAIDDDDVENLTRANPVNLAEREQKELQQKKQQKTFVFILILVVLAAAAIIGTVAGTSNKGDEVVIQTAAPTAYGSMEPSGVPSMAPTGVLGLLWSNLPVETQESLETYGTPQWKAFDWVGRHQNITNLPEWRKMQLFAMATFFYSMEGADWWWPIKERWMVDTMDECLWFSEAFGSFYRGPDGLANTGDEGEGTYYEDFFQIPLVNCNDRDQLTKLWPGPLGLQGLEPVVPPEIGLLTSLESLRLVGLGTKVTLFDMLAPKVLELGTFRALDIANGLGGTIPTDVGVLFANLTSLELIRNSFSGSLPTEIGLLTGLEGQFNLNSNNISGTIPTEMAGLTNVGTFWMSGNPWVGPIPTEFGTLSNADAFSFDRTFVSGWIPSEIALMETLEAMFLDSTLLTGRIPTEIGRMPSLERISLHDNSLSGSIPSELGLLTKLWHLDLSNITLLTGSIPPELSRLTGDLLLEGSGLSGTIPEGLCFLQDEACKNTFNIPPYGEWSLPCSLTFDCTERLCGCDCPCTVGINHTTI
ncbi:expressed unknown protein [Seminavis robusta]|uniref:L domain-like protein n=1 Tax=Seminavis robusta TaxID=568900 RepID=A0A9N8DQN8_9STRA|nr:expressed unknown protein [Seminavis robusta]|eukprot:Sro214_g088761.1  (776) ;mRNA; f:50885-53212